MISNSQIRYLTHQQIDKEKWDACLAGSANGLIYGFSFYLDHMARQWDALVLNDYEVVMPLTWNKKYGIRYLYQPFLCASLGVFGKSVSAPLIENFLLAIPAGFRYVDISLNHGNLYAIAAAGWYQRKNYILNLNAPYPELYSRFSDNVKRNIKKAAQNGLVIQSPSLPEVLQLAKLQFKQFAVGTNDDFNRFCQLYGYLEQQKKVATYGVATANGRLLSSCVFFFWQNRAYYILVGNHADSKGTGASHALINAFIKDHAATEMVLDLEGSDIATLALFYRSFGSQEENYPAIKSNRLPALLKWLKK